MKNRRTLILTIVGIGLLVVSAGAVGFADGEPSYRSITGPCGLKFPEDHGPHPGYRTEWWYYTGNLKHNSKRRYGFQLTFFRSQISLPGQGASWPEPASAWRTRQIYLAHAAISDIGGNRHLQAEIMSRQVLGIAGATANDDNIHVFLRNWSATIGPDGHRLIADTDNFSFTLNLVPEKPPVLHGNNGYSRKGSTTERASCYASLTRFDTAGTLTISGNTLSVHGTSWMDHEFSSAPLEAGLSGWDWFSLQLSDRTEIMIYLLRKEDNSLSMASSGTFVDAGGSSRHLTKDTFQVEILDHWKSPDSGARYPSRWHVEIPSLSMALTVAPALANQEMRTSRTTNVTYWEGSVTVKGTKAGTPVDGHGYVELTGYAKPFDAPM